MSGDWRSGGVVQSLPVFISTNQVGIQMKTVGV